MTSDIGEALGELTDLQRDVANWEDGALLVLAGPGSGKTRVITSRIARILEASPDRSFRVLALTFTTKAANEMLERVQSLAAGFDERTTICTFHAFCAQVLRQHGGHVGVQSDFEIYSLDADRLSIISDGLRRAGFPDEVIQDAGRYLPAIDRLKSRLVEPDSTRKVFTDPSSGDRIEAAYRAYEAELGRLSALDFNSLISQTVTLLRRFPAIAAQYQRTYPYWLIDEFQDTNDAQYQTLLALASPRFRNVVAVADDDQIMYRWNGASFAQLQRFREDFEPRLVQLPTNYRCPPAIVSAANALISHNQERTKTKTPLVAGRKNLLYPQQEHLTVRRFSVDSEEASMVAAEVKKRGAESFGRTAILGRTRAVLDPLLRAFQELGIPRVLAQRRDDFTSPQYRWLHSVLRLASRPLDRRHLTALVTSFNRFGNVEFQVAQIESQASSTARAFLEEWALAAVQLDDNTSVALAQLAQRLAVEPAAFRKFVAEAVPLMSMEENDGDLSDDATAWRALEHEIAQAVGGDASLEQFLQELALRSKEPPPPTNAVSLMTIHAAKGKEFDFVHLIGLAEEILPSFQSLKAGEVSPEMEEERRNCFVAITRTREALGLSWADRYRGFPKKPSRFLEEMGLAWDPA